MHYFPSKVIIKYNYLFKYNKLLAYNYLDPNIVIL